MTATLIGATGLIGNYLLDELLQDDYFDTVKILIRRPLEFSHPKLEKHLVDFNDGDSFLVALSSQLRRCTIASIVWVSKNAPVRILHSDGLRPQLKISRACTAGKPARQTLVSPIRGLSPASSPGGEHRDLAHLCR